MKKLLIASLMLLIGNFANSQYALSPGDNQLNIGVGASGYGIPIYIGFDHGFDENISFGAQVAWRGYNRNYFGERYRNSITNFSVNGNYHFGGLLDIPEEIDLYAGANIGLFIWTYGKGYYESGRTGLGIGLQLGGRYYISDKVGINLEFGGGYNAVGDGKIGISIIL
ncbi:MAG: hypothetical protein K1X54_09855 [Flavobacteriales bacterium]|nr:hypothetical protein [Flavobacteriales bacterium]